MFAYFNRQNRNEKLSFFTTNLTEGRYIAGWQAQRNCRSQGAEGFPFSC
jgi:hypothetical protein